MNRICFARSRGYSARIGSLTFRIKSASAHTASTGLRLAPSCVYSSSRKPLPTPAPGSMSTWWPWSTRAWTPAGVSATRCSPLLISLGTPMITSRLLYVAVSLGGVMVPQPGRGVGTLARTSRRTQRGRAARSGARPRAADRASRRYAPNFWGNCFTIASASGSAIIRM